MKIKLKRYFILFIFLIGCNSQTSIDKANKIVERIISETVDKTEKAEIKPLGNIQVIDFNHVFGENVKGVYYTKNAIQSLSDTTIEIGVSSNTPVSIKINSSIEYHNSEKREFYFTEEAYNLFSFQDTFSVNLKKGNNPIIIKAIVENEGHMYLRQITPYGEKTTIVFGDESSNAGWEFAKSDEKISQKNTKSLKSIDKNLPTSGWSKAPQLYYDKLVINETNTYKRESYFEWHYAIGTTMLGLINLNSYENNPEIYKFIKKYCDFALANRDTFKYQYKKLHALRTGNYRMFRKSMLDDTGPAALPFTKVYEHEKDEKYLEIVKEMTNYIYKEQARLEDGIFCRPEPAEMTIWADDLFMSSQLLLRSYKLFNNNDYLEDVILQIKKFHNYLWDPNAELHRHAWFDYEKKQSKILWSRANGWVIWTISTALKYIPEDHKDYSKVLEIYKTIIDGLIKYQGESGLWHQVLDRNDSFQETSGSSMFTLAIARGVKNGWLSEDYKKYAVKGWEGISRNISDDGIVKDICRGTGIGYDYDFYNNRSRFDNDPRGLGAVLTAAAEMKELIK